MSSKAEIITDIIQKLRNFRFCGPSDDPDEQSAVTLGYRYCVIQLQRTASSLLPAPAAAQLNAIDVDVHDLYSAFEAKAEIDALLPDIEDALKAPHSRHETMTLPKPIPVPVCAIVGDVLGSYIFHHKKLEALFYEAGAAGDVPPGNSVMKCQNWLKRMDDDVADPMAVLGKILEEFMEVDTGYNQEQQRRTGKNKRSPRALWIFLPHRRPDFGSGQRTSDKSLRQIPMDRDLAGVDKEFDRALANVETDPPAAVTAACSILESLFKVYIEDRGIEMPSDQTLKPLWKAASKHLGLDPGSIADDDLKKILSGLNSIVNGPCLWPRVDAEVS